MTTRPRPLFFFVVSCVAAVPTAALGQTADASPDTVWLNPPAGEGPARAVTGEIVELTGETVVMRRPSGQELSYEATRLVRFETARSAELLKAGQLQEAGDLAAALQHYRQALRAEPRRWMQRRILAEMISLEAALDRVELAGGHFLELLADDPATPDFYRVPLCWWAAAPSRRLEAEAANWLKSKEDVARLMGASWLLTTRFRADATAALEELKRSIDRRISRLAQAQLWRTQIATAGEETVDRWRRELAKFPPDLRGGPDYVAGQALARQKRFEPAARHLLRGPLTQPEHRRLAVRGLLEAGAALERAGHVRDAARLYREAIDRFAEEAGVEAKARLERLREKAEGQDE